MESGAERQSCIWSNSLWGWKCWKTPFFFFMVMENSITNLAWCWQAPYLSLSINLAKTMHPTSVIPQEPVPPKAAPTPPHLAGGPGWNQAPPKWLLLWGPAPHTRTPASVAAHPQQEGTRRCPQRGHHWGIWLGWQRGVCHWGPQHTFCMKPLFQGQEI